MRGPAGTVKGALGGSRRRYREIVGVLGKPCNTNGVIAVWRRQFCASGATLLVTFVRQ